ncbi:MAG: M3 family metallopeptidase [Bacteroidetes bacterium]|nr:M3 family metallopeptidase [Bacteroidota bacterium]MCL1968725.1 M3 family metallopeptidase [Bacteroidota bacterium]
MKKISLFTLVLCFFFSIHAQNNVNMNIPENLRNNPLVKDWDTPHQTPPFNDIKTEHFMPAFNFAIETAEQEIETIATSKIMSNFQTIIVPLESAGQLLTKVSGVFYNLLGSCTSPEIQALAKEISPMMTEYSNKIYLNENLFRKVEQVYSQKNELTNEEDMMLLEKMYQNFIRSGAKLNEIQKEKYRELSMKLSKLSLEFSENVLNYTNEYSKLFTDDSKLKGIPQTALEIAKSKAKNKNMEGYLFDISQPSYLSIMTYADDRDLRKEFFMAYNARAFKGKYDNSELIKEILKTRYEMAQLLGFENYAFYALEDRMAENPDNVYKLLNDLAEVSIVAGKKEVQEVQDFAKSLGFNDIIQRWDFSYYTEKLKDKKYSLNDELLKPYFKLEKVIEGVFQLTENLYGLTYKKNESIQVYHPDVTAYEVYRNKKFMGVLYLDFHPRESKRAGAWMNSYREQHKVGDTDIRPIVTLNMNFTPSTETNPSLLTFSEVGTFLHEFGHGLHGLFSDVHYESLSGTSVARDFVELPSQIMENWASEPDFLKTFAYHYQTGELIPQELIKKLKAAETYLAGYAFCRQLMFGFTDMMWHTIDPKKIDDVVQLELGAIQRVDLLPQAPGTCFSTSFNHIFSGGYAAGYYSYKWAEVLEADAFSLFKEKGVMNKEVANSFVENILSKGGSKKPMELFVAFRGREPKIDALMKKNGF